MQDAVAGRLRMGRPLSRRSDAALVRAAQRGSADAIDELFRRHWPAAHRAAWLVVHDAAAAEDIAQEAFLSALRALDRFDRRRPLGPWLHRIVVNRAIDWSRARALRPETAADALPEAAAPGEVAGDRRRRRRRARRPRPGAPRGRRPAAPARLHARRDRDDARPPARDRQLPAAPRARRARRRAGGGRDDPRRARARAARGRASRTRWPRASAPARPCSRRTPSAAPRRGAGHAVARGSRSLAATGALVAAQLSPAQPFERSGARVVAAAHAPRRAAAAQRPRAPRARTAADHRGRRALRSSSATASAAALGPGRTRPGRRRACSSPSSSGNTLAAIEPDGERPLAPARSPARCPFPRWAPDGTAHRLPLGRRPADRLRQRHPRRRWPAATWPPVAPAWRPSEPHTVAWAARDGSVTVEDADTAKVLWLLGPGVVTRMAWSADGRELLTAGRRCVHGPRRRRGQADADAPRRAGRRSWARRTRRAGSRLAVAVYDGRETSVSLDGAVALSAPGPVVRPRVVPRRAVAARGLAGRRPLARRPAGRARDCAVSAVRHRFGPARACAGGAAERGRAETADQPVASGCQMRLVSPGRPRAWWAHLHIRGPAWLCAGQGLPGAPPLCASSHTGDGRGSLCGRDHAASAAGRRERAVRAACDDTDRSARIRQRQRFGRRVGAPLIERTARRATHVAPWSASARCTLGADGPPRPNARSAAARSRGRARDELDRIGSSALRRARGPSKPRRSTAFRPEQDRPVRQ